MVAAIPLMSLLHGIKNIQTFAVCKFEKSFRKGALFLTHSKQSIPP